MLKRRCLKIAAFSVGVALGLCVGMTAALAAQAPATGRMIVGLKKPATPANVASLRARLPARVLKVGHGGQWILVEPKKGKTPAHLKAASPLIAYVEHEIAMSIPVQ